jgi:hypothetical protein
MTKDHTLLHLVQETNVLEQIDKLLAEYVWFKEPRFRLVVALWILHTHVYHQFEVTPRLALLSPMFQCGKTNILKLVLRLGCAPDYSEDFTPAYIYTTLEAGEVNTILFDEVNRIIAKANPSHLLFRLWNGNHRDSSINRKIGKYAVKFSTFAPMAFGARGKLPDDLTQRSIIIRMHRAPVDIAKSLKKLTHRDVELEQRVKALLAQIKLWARGVNLNASPLTDLANRWQDNWIPLLAIADYFDRGKEAREIATIMCAELPDDDAAAHLLMDIRVIFAELDTDRVWNKEELAPRLLKGDRHGNWNYWTGINGDQKPHPITGEEVAHMLYYLFELKTKSIRKLGGGQGSPTRKGYMIKSFEELWASYLPVGGTVAQDDGNEEETT